MIELRGLFPAIITPMNDDESLNLPLMREHIRRQLAAGAHGIFCLGTNGEFYSLTADEKRTIMETVVDEVKGVRPVVAGVGCITTSETATLARDAERIGVDTISVIVPYFAGVSQEQLYRHFRKTADAVSLPLLIYNIPMRTGNKIDLQTVIMLAKTENIVGIKDSSGNLDNVLQLIRETEDNFSVFVGTDSLVLETLKSGGAGAVSGCANVFPEIMVQIYESWLSGDLADAERVQEMVNPFRSTFKLGNPNSIVKRAVNLLGYPAGPAREPVNIDSPSIDAAIEEALRETAILWGERWK
jgi:4-hydroxy-tetrahydrodipicolinate synthase